MAEGHCVACRFWKVFRDGKGHCHKRAPWVDAQSGMTRWPMVEEKEWCGDFNAPGVVENYPAAERVYVHGIGSLTAQELGEARRAGRVERLPLDLNHPERTSWCAVEWWLETGTLGSFGSHAAEPSSSPGNEKPQGDESWGHEVMRDDARTEGDPT